MTPDLNLDTQVPDKKLYDVLYQHRYRELDGLRGIASMMVGIGHSMGLVVAMASASLTNAVINATGGVINGAIAVDLFFIMSGFFLTGMIGTPTARRLPKFYLRRAARLAPPAIASVALIYIFSRLALSGQPAFADAASAYLQFKAENYLIPAWNLFLNFILIRHTLNPALWTIRLEIFTSAIFPFVIMLRNLRPSFAYRFGLFWLFTVIAIVLRNHQKLGIDVFHYLYIFYAGTLIRDYGAAIGKLSSRTQVYLITAATILLLLTGEYDPTHAVHPLPFDFPVTILGSIIVTLLAYGTLPRLRAVMNGRPIQFLGRISYSFYLTNWLVVMVAGHLVLYYGCPARIGPFFSIMIITASVILIGIPVSALFHLAVERPSVALSRYLGK